MLGKLIKYEFRATARLFLPIYVAIILLAGLMCLLWALSDGTPSINFLTFIVGLAYTMAAVGLAATTVVVLVSRFYKNLLGAEGYLMFTLPVTTSQNILAKLIPALCWTVGSFILCFLVIFLRNLTPGPLDIGPIKGYTLGILLFLLLGLAGFILFCYLCMAIGQLFNQHKFLASVGAFLVVQLLLQIFGITGLFVVFRWGATLDLLNFRLDQVPAWAPLTLLNLGSLIWCLVLFLLTRWLLDKKLNLA